MACKEHNLDVCPECFQKQARESARRYRAKHKEKINQAARNWRTNNPEKCKEHSQRRYQLEKTAGHHTPKQWAALVSFYCPDGRCLACHEIKPLTKDHVVSLVEGGTNDITNLQPLCHKCNISKWANTMDYRPDRGAFAQQIANQ